MRVKKSYNPYLLLIFMLAVVFLQGCGKKEVAGTLAENWGVRLYGKEITDLKITPDYLPDSYLMEVSDTRCYYGCQTIEGENEEYFYKTEIYSKPLDLSEEGKCVVEIIGPSLGAFHIAKDEENGDLICVLTQEVEVCRLTEYSATGEVLRQLEIKDEKFVQSFMTNMVRYKDGGYLLYSSRELYCMDKDGKVSQPVACPGAYFQKALKTSKDEVYVIYRSEMQDYCMAPVDSKSGKLSEEFRLPGDDILLYADEEGHLLQLTDHILYKLSYQEKKSEKVYDFSTYNIPMSRGINMSFTGDEIRMICWDMSENSPIQLIRLWPKTEEELAREEEQMKENPQDAGKYDADGKRIITLYGPGVLIDLLGPNLIENFNMENEDYTVVLMDYNPNVEMVLASQDRPDIMYVYDSTMIEEYQRGGYLADLKPFIESSEIISMEELQSSVIDAFTFDGGIYALPQYATLETIMGPESHMEGRTGWTVEEFLNWLDRHPDVISTLPLNRDIFLEFCLKGNLEQYIDFEQGIANLTGDDFKSMLAQIRELEIQKESEPRDEYDSYDATIPRILYEYRQEVFGISMQRHWYQGALINMGFPNDKGEPKVMLNCITNLCMLESSECKEGAFAFIEYCMTYEYVNPMVEYEPDYSRFLWTYIPRRKIEKNAKREVVITYGNWANPEETFRVTYTITPEEEELLEEMFRIAVPDTYEKRTIRTIIAEEVQAYFLGQKSLEQVCDIMQSRVGILLSENR